MYLCAYFCIFLQNFAELDRDKQLNDIRNLCILMAGLGVLTGLGAFAVVSVLYRNIWKLNLV